MSETPDTCKARILAMRERLQTAFPKVFPKSIKDKGWRPLAVGIREAIADRLALTDPRELQALTGAIASHCRSSAYMLALVKISHRFDLDGKAVGTVTDTDRAQAKERLKAKQAKAKPRKPAPPKARKVPPRPPGKPTPRAAPVVIRKRRKLATAQKAPGAAPG